MHPLAESKRQRRFAAKVRTGCHTCKKKCDETRPHCLRCIKAKYICDGYDDGARQYTFKSCYQHDTARCTSLSQAEQALPTEDSCRPSVSKEVTPTQEGVPCEDNVAILNLIQPSTFSAPGFDQDYTQYFLRKVGPVLASTEKWKTFWLYLVPQASASNKSIHYAMTALAATCESKISGLDHGVEINRRCHLAVREFTSQHASAAEALILCRLFSSMAQRNRNWAAALTHMQSGASIIRETRSTDPTTVELVKLMAPSLLSITLGMGALKDTVPIPTDKMPRLADLRDILFNYKSLLQSITQSHWRKIDSLSKSLITMSWSIMTQAICSILYSNILHEASEASVMPALQVRSVLLATGRLLSLEELRESFQNLFYHIHSCIAAPEDRPIMLQAFKNQIKICVENFVVQAADIEPRMPASTLWHETDEDVGCAISQPNTQHYVNIDSCKNQLPHHSAASALRKDSPLGKPDLPDEGGRYYLEFVCPYRSGFMPAFAVWE